MKKRITALLKKSPGLKARQIAHELGVDRKEVSSFFVKNLDAFVQDPQTYTWSLVQSASFVLEISSSGLWVTQFHFEKALKKSGSPLDTDHGHVVIKVVNEQKVLLCAAGVIVKSGVRPSGSVPVRLIIHLYSILKLNIVHDQLQLIESLYSLPAFLSGLEQFEYHR